MSRNKFAGLIAKVNGLVPSAWRSSAYSLMFNSQVKLAGTAGIRIESLTGREAVVHLKNRRKVQNHIGGVHACGMALLAESATGMIVGMNVPDTHLPLMKSMKVSFVKRAQGDLKAVATLTPQQISEIGSKDRGDVLVDVVVTDEKGDVPCKCEMLWAWTSKQRKPKPPSSTQN